MTPAARLSAAAEVLDQIARTRAPAEAALKAWGQKHRFAGSGDRRAISERVYGCLRAKGRLAARMGEDSGRALVLGSLAELDGLDLEEIERLHAGGGYGPAPLSDEEWARLAAGAGEAGAGLPDFVVRDLKRGFGDGWAEEAEALTQSRAPVDLRANAAKATREAVLAELAEAGLNAQPTPWSPWGLRLAAGSAPALQALDVWRNGHFEVQDEGSQVTAWLAGAGPGMVVVDYCAGGGGKTLALASLLFPSPSDAGSAAAGDPGTQQRDHSGGVAGGAGAADSGLAARSPGSAFGRPEDDGTENPSNPAHPDASQDPDLFDRAPTSQKGLGPPPAFAGAEGKREDEREKEKSRLIACDVVASRLKAIRPRLARAGVTAELRLLSEAAAGVEDLTGQADLVFVDAPCSGSGTWRRHPEAAWRLTEAEVERLHALQVEILARAAVLARSGARLVYVTCSVLTRENEDSIAAFEAAHPQFRPVPITGPLAALARNHTLRLSPRRTDTDGFFAAVYERTA